VLTSSEFVQMARAAGTPGQQDAARSLAFSRPFTKFARSLGNVPKLSNRERFILNSLQATTGAQGIGSGSQ
jgi:hypothetical protein